MMKIIDLLKAGDNYKLLGSSLLLNEEDPVIIKECLDYYIDNVLTFNYVHINEFIINMSKVIEKYKKYNIQKNNG